MGNENNIQPPSFDTAPQVEANQPRLSPSEEFALAHPDFKQPERPESTYDPNARRTQQLRGSGGGFAAAVAGELQFDESVTSDNTTTVEHSEISPPTEAYKEARALLSENSENKSRKYRVSSQVAGRLAAAKFLDDKLGK